ncbi:DUF2202 domain-containing protein [Lacihabitans sp. LS3-19]|uniref:DUF2202 domain-containing protein n=1 Tax=Lacihabitans sp. LS3-19 TaxID=2487335 RepID=UPI0020CEBCD3|nr:DUF2202 domain-containing protein [Lacihabitans sp. LS3-19]MCP9767119.1 DUF2202 domain-containing protein [Lacihabitans sp. LS3-19]
MEKSLFKITIFIASFFWISSCSKDQIVDPQTSSYNQAQVTQQISNLPTETISEAEKSGLLYMREEEKLAKDVYVTLYKKWNLNVFNNISSSEETHTSAVLSLLQKYNIPDPVVNNAVGVFENVTLQKLYTDLVTQGSVSLLEGVKVGATIEDLDIKDLEEYLKDVDNQDITYVYQNLTKGSRNHLRSFYSQVLAQNGTYAAQFITQSEFDAIVNSARETGSW